MRSRTRPGTAGQSEDKTRLLYVAVTRAQKCLYATLAPVADNQQQRARSDFFHHIAAQQWMSTISAPNQEVLSHRVRLHHARPPVGVGRGGQHKTSYAQHHSFFELCPNEQPVTIRARFVEYDARSVSVEIGSSHAKAVEIEPRIA